MFEQDHWSGVEITATTEESPLHQMDRATKAMAAASATALTAVAIFDDQKQWRSDGATSMSAWLAARYGLAWGTAREWVRVAHALRSLPSIANAYAAGRLSWDQLRPLTRFATPESDEGWARKAPSMSAAALHREAARHQKITEQDATDLHRRRYLSMWWDEELPLLYLQGTLAGDQGAAVKQALEQRAKGVEVADDPHSPEQARMPVSGMQPQSLRPGSPPHPLG